MVKIARFVLLFDFLSAAREAYETQTDEMNFISFFLGFLVTDLENNVIETENVHTRFQREQWAQIRANSILFRV